MLELLLLTVAAYLFVKLYRVVVKLLTRDGKLKVRVSAALFRLSPRLAGSVYRNFERLTLSYVIPLSTVFAVWYVLLGARAEGG